MNKTSKRIILSALSLIITSCFADSRLSTPSHDTNVTTTQQFDLALSPTATNEEQINSQEHASQKKRMRKPKNKTEKTKKIRTYLDMDYENLVIAKNVQKEKNNISVTIKYVEQLMKLCNNITLLADHLLELADLFFEDAQFQKATHLYTQYCSLYPGSAQQEYALYRSITSSFACILSVDRDQTQTEETLALTEIFLKQDHFTTYKDDVTQIQTQCCQQLAASECNICSFYLTRGKLTAAEKRLKKIRSHWLPKISTIEPNIIALETELAEQKELRELLTTKTTTLAENKKSKHMADRF